MHMLMCVVNSVEPLDSVVGCQVSSLYTSVLNTNCKKLLWNTKNKTFYLNWRLYLLPTFMYMFGSIYVQSLWVVEDNLLIATHARVPPILKFTEKERSINHEHTLYYYIQRQYGNDLDRVCCSASNKLYTIVHIIISVFLVQNSTHKMVLVMLAKACGQEFQSGRQLSGQRWTMRFL